ncbi:hypothetical protein GGR51DRAFT_536863 [Nemania sp. FL0031]|nr:hypothetical protein GGR51DRAFT_536863 [Nemania sp. FL0031]
MRVSPSKTLSGQGAAHPRDPRAPYQDSTTPSTAIPIARARLSHVTWGFPRPDAVCGHDCGHDSYREDGIHLRSTGLTCLAKLGAVGCSDQAAVAPTGSSDENADLTTISGRGLTGISLGCVFASPPFRGAYNHCATQRKARTVARIQVGDDTCITRWVRGSKIKYVVDNASFGSSNLAITVANNASAAASTWQNIGVAFELVPSESPATFQIKYRELPFNRDRGVYAESFFPQDGAGTLFVYKLALTKGNIGFLSNVLAHELGHVLGLRHEHASDVCEATGVTKESGCVRWGLENRASVMNYFPHLKDYMVRSQDLAELKSFYDFTGERYGNMEIRDFVPQLFHFAKEEGREAKLVSSPTS